MSALPPGWVWTDTATVTEVQGGIQKQPKRRPTVNHYPFLRVANVMRERLDLREVHEIELFDGELERFRLRAGDLLVVEGNGSPDQIGRAARWRGDIEDCVHQNHLIRVRPTAAIDSKYLEHYWNARKTTEYLRSVASSTSGLYVLTTSKVRSVRIPLAPLQEQLRIITAIEEHFSRLDAGVAALERARQNLKHMSAAVLQAAVTDALECTDQVMTPLANLLSAPLANGKSVPDGPASGFPVLRLTAVRDGWIDVTCSKKGAWTADEAKPYIIQKGDYLVVRGNGSRHLVGRGAMVGVDSDVAYPDTLIRLRFDETAVVPRYVALIWNSTIIRNQIEGAARTTAGIYKINQKDLKGVAFPVPSIENQARIHASVDSVLYAIGVLEAQVNAQLQRSDALRSAILAAAFSGKLVAQDASDEPANVLLARIAAEQTGSNGQKLRRSSTPARVRKKATV